MRAKKILRPLLFLIMLLLIGKTVIGVLEKPINEQWDASGFSYVYNHKDFYDVIFSGTSMVITNVSLEQLYTDYGIAAVTLGEPSQKTFLAYYSVEEALKYQSPKVVCFDVNSLFYSEAKLKADLKNEYNALHYTLDGMRTSRTKYEAFQAAKEIKSNLNFWNYFSKLYYNHSNWEKLTEDNFVRESGDTVMNGNTMLFDVGDTYAGKTFKRANEVENTGEIAEIPEINLKYLIKMINLCKEKGVQLVLLQSGGNIPWTWKEYNAIQKISEEYNIPYYDMNLYEEEMEFDWQLDMADEKHFNVIGTEKWTSVLGRLLKDNWELPDRRGDNRYEYFIDLEEQYQDALEAMKTKQNLVKAINFDNYLDALIDMDRHDNTIFIVIRDEGTKKLSEGELLKLSSLGLSADLAGKYRQSYYAVIDTNGIQEVVADKLIGTKGILDNQVSYLVRSGGHSSYKRATISIDGEEWIAGGRGFNIVVYNKRINQVLSSVYFDTCKYENPSASRIETIDQKQYESEVNVWVPY